MGLYKNFLVRISGNRTMQRLIEKQVRVLNHALGVGAGGEFAESGEYVLFDLLYERCQPPFCIFDVGANKGQFLAYALGRMKVETYSIHCFEPSLETFRMLQASCTADTRIHLNNLGLGGEKSESLLYSNAKGAEGASLTKRDLGHFGISFDHSETVHIETLDNYCRDKGVERISILKLDVEGHELDALKGSTEMIARKAIDMILFEFGGCNIDTRKFFRDYWQFFQNTGMDLYRVTPSGYLAKITSYREEYEQFLCSNFIALKSR